MAPGAPCGSRVSQFGRRFAGIDYYVVRPFLAVDPDNNLGVAVGNDFVLAKDQRFIVNVRDRQLPAVDEKIDFHFRRITTVLPLNTHD